MMAFDAVPDLFVRESQNRPLVLAVEDLHWIDKTSEGLPGYLVEFLENANVLLNQTGGNPLFVEELTHNLLENGAIKKQGQEYVLSTETGQLEVPDTLQGIIAARIDRVEENLKRIMQVASVVGREFAFRLLQNILEMREDLRSSLFNLQGKEFLNENRGQVEIADTD